MEGILGKTLDKTYRLDQLLGRGGMGAVYRAHDMTLDRDVAIKIMHSHLSEDPTFRARFLQEARAIAALEHPGIVQVYACGEDLGLLYIVMDFIPGQTLQNWLKRLATERGIVVLSESLAIIEQVALGLYYAHAKGVVHRDVKPSNIMMKPTDPMLRRPEDMDFRPVLTDFGLAKLAAGGVHTLTGSSMGTPAYMSPEQCRGLDLDGRADIYSLGVVLFEMVTGRVPFEVQSLTEAIRCHTEEPPPPPRSVNPSLPLEVENLVLRTLAKRAEDRFPSALEMAEALRDVVSRLPADLASAGPSIGRPLSPSGEAPTAYLSLMTLLRQESVFPPPPPTRQWEAAPSATPGSASLVFASPDGQSRRVQLGERRVLTVGRGEENDVQLADLKVSRRHARIGFDGRNLTVTDLNSTNGSFIGNSRLLAGVSQPWSTDTALRLGDHWVRLEAQEAPATSFVGAVTPTPRAGQVEGERLADAALQPQRLAVEAGGTAECRLVTRNLGTQVDHFQVSVTGVPGTWIPAPPPVILLNPSEEQEVRLAIQPPRSPEGRAGTHPLTVTVTSQTFLTRVAEAKGILTVAPFHQFDLALRPQRQSGMTHGTFTLQISNQGNAEIAMGWEATDPEEGCLYLYDPPQVVLAPGEVRSVRLEVRPKAQLSSIAGKSYPFVITARPVQAPELARQAQGEWTHLPPDFDLELSPQRQVGIAEGDFRAQVSNHGAVELEIQLGAKDPGESCLYAFEPPQLTVPAGGQQQAKLSVRPKTPLPEGTSRTFAFALTARPTGAPRLIREVQGEWEQIPPAFEVALSPQTSSGIQEGTYRVQVSNQCAADLSVQLQGVDTAQSCQYTFSPSKVNVPPGQQREAQLVVRAKAAPGSAPRSIPFTITARPVEAPHVVRQVQGEWTQVPVAKPVARPAVGPLPPAAPPGATSTYTSRPFWGCATLVVCLILTAAIGWGIGFFVGEVLDLYDLSLVIAIVVWLGGVIVSIVVARLVWRKRVRLPPRPTQLPEE